MGNLTQYWYSFEDGANAGDAILKLMTTVKQTYKFGLNYGLGIAGWEIINEVSTTNTTSILVKKENIELLGRS